MRESALLYTCFNKQSFESKCFNISIKMFLRSDRVLTNNRTNQNCTYKVDMNNYEFD